MRTASVNRSTSETRIAVSVNLDGTGAYNVSTGIGFLDHMLDLLARHSRIDLTVKAKGDKASEAVSEIVKLINDKFGEDI